ncbi:general odorant-binding protein 19d-like [Diorhabda carinulata]|uniref:general odorant-binding protein 19d-like n=1 Tax=Diorhabda carinulata TaxID=1163345 RepID=UPI0025A0B47C|nr:general odorant-binding protein 19d-like [Diorhabda carinulata]
MRGLKLVFVLIFLIENSLEISLVEQKLKQTTKVLLGNCRAKSGATKEDFEMLRSRQIPSTKSGLCLMECLFEGARIIDNGKFNKDGMITALTPAMKGDASKLQKLNELGKTCESQINNKKLENCQTGEKILECLAKNGNKYGLEIQHNKN